VRPTGRIEVKSVAVIDSGLGNSRAVLNMIRRAGGAPRLARTPLDFGDAGLIVLPGVGAFDAGMRALSSRGLGEAILERASTGTRVLGICLGMQLLSNGSAEGSLPGLGLVNARFESLSMIGAPRVPHVGWNRVYATGPSALFSSTDQIQRFYFSHSYFAQVDSGVQVLAKVGFGQDFICAYGDGPAIGVQFHPEKSHKFGLQMFRRLMGQDA